MAMSSGDIERLLIGSPADSIRPFSGCQRDCSNDFRRKLVVGLSGGYNDNGIVDAAGYTVWRHAFGQLGPSLAADSDGDHDVDADDYGIWKQHLGAVILDDGAGVAATTVPEPGSGMLAVVGTLIATIVAIAIRV
jgi:hypothetical protein